ncbi:diguanylate cyclase/phosphodiesterase (GGDEF & EAL domains) with PAS/PAC sensor [Minicystis rosea]|nr:diguanylate cyclase/phosphodiesterase (GGDEF & EAL domains) with PAS/PAC sensor [Minicystis rosea]
MPAFLLFSMSEDGWSERSGEAMTTAIVGSDAKRVLLVGDPEIAAGLIATSLVDLGFAVIKARDLASAVALLGDARPDVAVCEARSAGEIGLSVARGLAAADETLGVVIVCRDADAERAVRADSGDFDDIRDGDDVRALARAVRRAAERTAARRDNRRLSATLDRDTEALERRVAEVRAELADAHVRLQASLAAHAALEERVSREARLDVLTEIGNRLLLRERLSAGLGDARRNATSLAILIIDLDDFKPVNDSFGHAVGDEILAGTARRLRASARDIDTVARLGGDDFAMVLPGAGIAEATLVAGRVAQALAEPHRAGGADILLGSSIGMAVSATGEEGPDELLRNAGLALATAKRRGGGHELFRPEMHAALAASLGLRLELRRAVERQEFFLEYQPVVSIETGAIVGVEALVRWRHPERGIVPPGVFIGLAEETGLIVPLGRWVLREACAMLARRGGGISLSVNVSARQLFRDELVDDVASAIAQSGIDPRSLVLEVTESIALEERQPILFALRELGVRLSIDDFGTGYSSLAYLRRLPVDAVKIHKSFIDGIAEGDAQLARAILRFGREMGLSTTAEGIEHPEQWAALRELGCDLGQGYYFSRPVSEERLDAAIAKLPVSR